MAYVIDQHLLVYIIIISYYNQLYDLASNFINNLKLNRQYISQQFQSIFILVALHTTCQVNIFLKTLNNIESSLKHIPIFLIICVHNAFNGSKYSKLHHFNRSKVIFYDFIIRLF